MISSPKPHVLAAPKFERYKSRDDRECIPRIPAELVRKIVFMGLPLLVNELLWSGGMTMLNQCYSVRGLEVVSAMNISTTVILAAREVSFTSPMRELDRGGNAVRMAWGRIILRMICR